MWIFFKTFSILKNYLLQHSLYIEVVEEDNEWYFFLGFEKGFEMEKFS